jgi:hypothetical protein
MMLLQNFNGKVPASELVSAVTPQTSYLISNWTASRLLMADGRGFDRDDHSVRIATVLATEFGSEPICSTTSPDIAVTVVATH